MQPGVALRGPASRLLNDVRDLEHDLVGEGEAEGLGCKGSRIVQKADHQKCRGAAAGPAPAPRDPKREWPVREWEHVAHIGTGGSPCSPESFGWNSTSCTSMAGPLAR